MVQKQPGSKRDVQCILQSDVSAGAGCVAMGELEVLSDLRVSQCL